MVTEQAYTDPETVRAVAFPPAQGTMDMEQEVPEVEGADGGGLVGDGDVPRRRSSSPTRGNKAGSSTPDSRTPVSGAASLMVGGASEMGKNPSAAFAEMGRHPSAAFADDVDDGVRSQLNPVVEYYTKRGQLDVQGAAYYAPEDIEDEQYSRTTYVGLAYQVSSLALINSVTETFRVVLDLSMIYKIADEDKDEYERYQRQGSVSFQEMFDKGGLTVKPPVFEYRNAVVTPEETQGRVVSIQRCYDHRGGSWAWYVTLYLQVRAECSEEFEMRRFPFTRNSLQVCVQCQMGMSMYMLVPFNSRSALPHYFWDEKAKQVQECFKRGNSLKLDKIVGNWTIEQHHAFFMPDALSAPMPSGNKFSTCIICVQCKQPAQFFVYNTAIVIVWLPILAMLCVVEDVDAVWDRMSIVLTLLLTMATYKIVIADWIPQKDYLTFMDQYIIVGFGLILFVAAWVMLTAVFAHNASGLKELLDNMEVYIMGVIALIWAGCHVYLVFTWDSWYSGWDELLRDENSRLQDIADGVLNERKQMAEVKLLSCPKPSFPESGRLSQRIP